MSIKTLFDKFDEIESTSGKLDKLALLQAIKADEELGPLAMVYFSIAMDWYRIFNVGEKSLDAEVDLDHEVFGAPPKSKKVVSPAKSWVAFLHLIGRIENGGDDKPNKEEIRNFVNGVTDPQANKWIVAALLKKTRMGVSEKTVNKVWPKLINYFEVQLADTLDDPKAIYRFSYNLTTLKGAAKKRVEALPDFYYLEPKLDGIRAVCRVNPAKGTVSFFSRGGQVLNNTGPAGINDFLLQSCREEVIFDGELFGANWNETTKVTSKGEGEADPELVAKLRFFVFDMLTADEWDAQKCEREYTVRREAIAFECMSRSDAKVVKTISHACTTPEDIAKWSAHYLKAKYEGVMVKHPHGLYEFKRSTDWLKFKPLMTDEFEVVGKFEGKVKSKYEGKLGGLIVRVPRPDGFEVLTTCQVGSGFSDEEREAFWADPPLGKMVEIEFKEKTPDGLLREPVFVRVREDKKPNE
jgi:DNA ligase-1